MKRVDGGVTKAKGFLASSGAAEIKYKGREDMAMIYSSSPCTVAGAFTKNLVKAAPVKWDSDIVHKGMKVNAVVVNSGIANACTGEEGMAACVETAKAAALALGLEPENVLLGSTGVIGMPLPVDKMKAGVKMLAGSLGEGAEFSAGAAGAIMTTDTCVKEIAVEFDAGGKKVIIGGIAKGSGMIHPNMCTMLAFLTTDAVISEEALRRAILTDVENTYNMISVDGDTSTNDTVLILANGQAGNEEIRYGTEDYQTFLKALNVVNEYLARKIAGDGEGATTLLEVIVEKAVTKDKAKTIAKSVVCSNLTKTAIAGHDANWGRILCAMGYSGEVFDPEIIDLYFVSSAGKIQIMDKGTAVVFSEEKAAEILSAGEITVLASLNEGNESAAAWGCDLTHGYIDINADYRS